MAERNIHKSVNLGNNIAFEGDVTIHKGATIGDNVTIYPKVTIGQNTRIFDGAVIGRPPVRVGITTRPLGIGADDVYIGDGCVIGANCVLYNNLSIGDNVLIGDLASIREGCHIGQDVVIGRGVLVMYDTTIQERSRIIDGAIITGNMLIESDVFIGPGVTTVNDNDVYLRRFDLIPFEVQGPIVRRFAVIGTGANLSAGIEIGMGALVAPSAMVTKDVPAWTIVAGVPAHELRKIDDEIRLQVLRHFNLSDGDIA